MDKRGELFKNLFLVSILIVMVIVGAYFVMGVVKIEQFDSAGNRAMNATNFTNNMTRTTNVSWGIYWTNYSSNDTLNFTINHSGDHNGTSANISYINITFPVGVFITTWNTNNTWSNTTGGALDPDYNVSWNITANNATAVDVSGGSAWVLTIQNETEFPRGGDGLPPNQSISFLVNVSFNGTTLNNTEQNLTFKIDVYDNDTKLVPGHSQVNITYGGVDGLAPRLLELNVTSSGGHIIYMGSSTHNFNGTGGYFRNDTTLLNFSVMINDTNLDTSNVTLYVNISGHSTGCGVCHGGDNMYSNATAIRLTNNQNISARVKVFNGTISDALLSPSGFRDGNISTFSIVAYDIFGHVAYLNNSEFGFNVTFDEKNPTASIVMPATTTIETSESIKFECTAADAQSGVNSSKTQITITKPGEGGVVIKGTEGSSKHTFTSTDTNVAGTYTVNCNVADNVGHTGGATSETFRVQYASGGVTPSAGPSGPSADISITEPTGESTTTAKEGNIKTFTLDGTTIHKITFLKVTTSSVTLKIESDPVEITLNIGETKEVDIDGDGNIDIEVRLNSITDGVADISVKKVGLPAGEIAPEEIEEEVAPEEVIEKAPSRAGLVVAIIIIIVVVIAVIYFLTKKKKK